jgi:hypothetical protein
LQIQWLYNPEISMAQDLERLVNLAVTAVRSEHEPQPNTQ